MSGAINPAPSVGPRRKKRKEGEREGGRDGGRTYARLFSALLLLLSNFRSDCETIKMFGEEGREGNDDDVRSQESACSEEREKAV